MVAKTCSDDFSYDSDFRKDLLIYMSVLHNWHGLVYTYITMINDIVLVQLGHHVSATITLTRIATFQVLGLALFYIPHLWLPDQ